MLSNHSNPNNDTDSEHEDELFIDDPNTEAASSPVPQALIVAAPAKKSTKRKAVDIQDVFKLKTVVNCHDFNLIKRETEKLNAMSHENLRALFVNVIATNAKHDTKRSLLISTIQYVLAQQSPPVFLNFFKDECMPKNPRSRNPESNHVHVIAYLNKQGEDRYVVGPKIDTYRYKNIEKVIQALNNGSSKEVPAPQAIVHTIEQTPTPSFERLPSQSVNSSSSTSSSSCSNATQREQIVPFDFEEIRKTYDYLLDKLNGIEKLLYLPQTSNYILDKNLMDFKNVFNANIKNISHIGKNFVDIVNRSIERVRIATMRPLKQEFFDYLRYVIAREYEGAHMLFIEKTRARNVSPSTAGSTGLMMRQLAPGTTRWQHTFEQLKDATQDLQQELAETQRHLLVQIEISKAKDEAIAALQAQLAEATSAPASQIGRKSL